MVRVKHKTFLARRDFVVNHTSGAGQNVFNPPMIERPSVRSQPLQARQYRELWLNSEDQLGLIAECLAEALQWSPTGEQPLPDPLTLAEMAAERILELQAQCVLGKITRQPIESKSQHLAFSLN